MRRSRLVLIDSIVLLRTGYRFGMDTGLACSDCFVMRRHSDTYSNTDPDTNSYPNANANSYTYAYTDSNTYRLPGIHRVQGRHRQC